MPKLHDLLCKHLLREALDPIGTVELEKPVAPLDEQRIDVYCERRAELPPAEAVSHLGLVRRMAEVAQRFLIEPFSATPCVESVDDTLRKKFNLHHGLKKAAKGSGLAKPALWVLSPGRPGDVLQGYAGASVATGRVGSIAVRRSLRRGSSCWPSYRRQRTRSSCGCSDPRRCSLRRCASWIRCSSL